MQTPAKRHPAIHPGIRLRVPGTGLVLGLLILALGYPDLSALTHTVRKGDTLSSIAAQYGVDTANLARTNSLGDADLVMVGQSLRIPANGSPFINYRVTKGDNLASIANRFGVSVREISDANNLRNNNLLKVGQVLRIPNRLVESSTYTVRKGDSLASIATKHGISANAISEANGLKNANLLQVGQILVLPGVKPEPTQTSPQIPSTPTPSADPPTTTVAYTVRKGDILAEIATKQGVPASVIAQANHLSDANLLTVGQVLVIPGGKSAASNGSTATPSTVTTTYTVRKGDNLASISTRHGVTVGSVARANALRDADHLVVGQELTIPSGKLDLTAYTVRKGESLGTIAARHRISVSDILAHNHLPRPDRIAAGQVLLLPTDKATAPPAPKPVYPVLPSSIKRSLDKVRVKTGQWKHIVIHHSGMPLGSGKNIDRYHREERHMENGLAYHFVIGNGNGMKDGEIFIGDRWKKQIEGGHLAIHALNLNSIGIGLIGNFEKDRPSARQLNSLEALTRYLLARTGLPVSAVTTHKLIHPKHTLCPGRRFPTTAFENRLKK